MAVCTQSTHLFGIYCSFMTHVGHARTFLSHSPSVTVTGFPPSRGVFMTSFLGLASNFSKMTSRVEITFQGNPPAAWAEQRFIDIIRYFLAFLTWKSRSFKTNLVVLTVAMSDTSTLPCILLSKFCADLLELLVDLIQGRGFFYFCASSIPPSHLFGVCCLVSFHTTQDFAGFLEMDLT